MSSPVEKSTNAHLKDKEKALSNQNVTLVKSTKKLKSPKKCQESKKSVENEMRMEDIFLNSEYFKHQSGNFSSLSFCSGDNGSNQWTAQSMYEAPLVQKPLLKVPYSSEASLNEVVSPRKEKEMKVLSSRTKKVIRSNSREKTENILEGILSGKSRLDRDLITLITEQMFLAEKELQVTRSHLMETIGKLNERDLEIIQLNEKIRHLQKCIKADNTKSLRNLDAEDFLTTNTDDYQRLFTASEKLKKQVKDMEEFLNDYGLVWVGDKDANTKPDFDKIVKCFQRLNTVAAQPKIIQTTLGARFEIPKAVPVTLYSNGLLLKEDDFREFSKVSTNLFLQDLEDGYFPGELQTEFPEGVPFQVFDKRNETFMKSKKIFNGSGSRLGSTFEGKSASIVFLEPVTQKKINENHSVSSLDFIEKTYVKRTSKIKSKNVILESSPRCSTAEAKFIREPETRRVDLRKKLRLKIRYGKDQTEIFYLEIPENEKMFVFQEALTRSLCSRHHDDFLLHPQTNFRPLDFEIHVYGSAPFRLSDQLNHYPAECGLVHNCVINPTTIRAVSLYLKTDESGAPRGLLRNSRLPSCYFWWTRPSFRIAKKFRLPPASPKAKATTGGSSFFGFSLSHHHCSKRNFRPSIPCHPTNHNPSLRCGSSRRFRT